MKVVDGIIRIAMTLVMLLVLILLCFVYIEGVGVESRFVLVRVPFQHHFEYIITCTYHSSVSLLR